MGRNRPKRTHVKNKDGKKARKTWCRSKDIDQIQDEIKAGQVNPETLKKPIDGDLPGLGQFFCISCSRYFINQEVLEKHCAGRLHKRRLKLVAEQQYTQKEADMAAGLMH